MNEPKLYKCKNIGCENKFDKKHPFQTWCSLACGYLISKRHLDEAYNKKAKELAQKNITISEEFKLLQPYINKIARLIDQDLPCISCGSKFGKPQGGHYRASTNTRLRFNLHNVHKQCFRCNHELSGNVSGYIEGLKTRYGNEYFERVNSLYVEVGEVNWSKEDIREAKVIAAQVCRELETNHQSYMNVGERITHRDRINERIKLYKCRTSTDL